MKNQPETFPALSARGHRPRIGKEPRVLLASTTVDPLTKQTLADWQRDTGRNLGGVLDASVSFAKSKGFPRASHAIHKSKKAGARSSTSAAPAPTA